MTADQRYQELLEKVEHKIKCLQDIVNKHNNGQGFSRKNWTDVGEMCHINESLGELLESFPLS